MALHGAVTITCTKIVDGKKRAVTYSGDGKDITIITANLKCVHPTGASDEDSIFEMNDGTLIYGIADFDDTSNLISATDLTGS